MTHNILKCNHGIVFTWEAILAFQRLALSYLRMKYHFVFYLLENSRKVNHH